MRQQAYTHEKERVKTRKDFFIETYDVAQGRPSLVNANNIQMFDGFDKSNLDSSDQ